MIDSFNIRVYALCIKDEKILILNEEYAGKYLTKLPGGGLEFGEGTLECLQRELAEELNLSIKSAEHFYTQEDFLVSRFKDNEQLLTIYYKVELENDEDLLVMDPCIEQVVWHPIADGNPFDLPIDKIVYEKIVIEREY